MPLPARAFDRRRRDLGTAARAGLGGRSVPFGPLRHGGQLGVEIDLLLERAVQEGRDPEVQDQAVGLDPARVDPGIERAEAAADHLDPG